ncbi:MAG: hypothetical protein Q7S65_00710 [Nanoarchaeota archaeon]|nr:hypothetical protein [Nanoarchaeota archaeon]
MITLYTLVGILGILLITVGVLYKKKQDWLFLPGGVCLLVYSISIRDAIFIALQSIYIAAVLFDLRKQFSKK